MIAEQSIKAFVSGTENLLPDEVISKDAASDSLSWLTNDGHVELIYGRQTIGGSGAAGKNYGEHTAFKANGNPVRFRKVESTIQYSTLSGSTWSNWTNVITGLTIAADYVFSNYQSLAGAFVYIFGIDGIYKICVANPGDYATLYDATKNFKGYGLIDKARTILWNAEKDKTGLYGSYIDAQNSTVYTTVTGEATTTLSGTLAFKAGDAKRTCFGVSIVVGTETFTDNYNGVLTGSAGGTGTINYMTGAYTVSTAGVGTASYQWENSNNKGVTDFTKSATRLAGEGFVVRQDAGGDAIVSVIPLDGSYFSLKAHSCYKFTLDAEDLNPTNEIFRTDIGISSLRSATGTGRGIIFMNTGNVSRPILQILQRNPLGDNFDVVQLFPKYKFQNFTYTDALVDSWDQYAIIGCQSSSLENNRLLLCNIKNKTVDVTPYGIRTSAKYNGILYGGDPVSQTTYELFTGFDDNSTKITNYWNSKGETYGTDMLKKVKRARFKGKIVPDQSIKVSISIDDGDFQWIGTILGSGDYVDAGSSFAIGTTAVGFDVVGGQNSINVYNYFMEMKLHVGKFRKRVFRFEALGYGYCSVEQLTDFDIWTYQQKMPSKYRIKQNVSLSGAQTDVANPPY